VGQMTFLSPTVSKKPMATSCHISSTSGLLKGSFMSAVPVALHRHTNFGRRAFTVAGPTAWNSLPDYLRDLSLSEDTFRRLLKTYLFLLY